MNGEIIVKLHPDCSPIWQPELGLPGFLTAGFFSECDFTSTQTIVHTGETAGTPDTPFFSFL